MKKLYFLLCLVLTTISGFSQLLYEPFSYTPDPTLGLATQSGNGTVWKIINSGDSVLLDAGSLSYTGLAASTGNKVKFDGSGTDYYRSFTNQTTGTVYASFLLNVSSLGGLNTTGGYFFALTDGSSSSNHGSTVWLRLSGTGYNIGVNSRTLAANTSWLSPTLSTGTTYLVVVSYTIVSGTLNDYASIWLNPVTLGSTAPPADAVATPTTSTTLADLTNVGRVQIRQDATAATPFIQFDELRIGTDFASVTPPDASVTTPTLNVSSLPSFGSLCINSTGGPNSFNIGGSNLTAADITVGPLAGYTFSTTSGGTYTNSLTLTHGAGSYFQTVYVKFTPTAVQSYNGNIPVSGGGATATNVAAVGAGINVPVVTTGAVTSITTSGATAAGTIVNNGCSAPTAYGIEYSTTNNFTPGTGTQVASTNIASGAYTSALTGLQPGVIYYYVAYATNASGTGYGTQSSFTTAVPPAPTQAPVATAATGITTSGFTANWNAVVDATNYRLDVFTQSTATLTNTNIAGWNMTNAYIPRYADTGTIYNVVNIDSVVSNATNAITNANGPSGGIGTTPNPYALQATGWDAGQDTKYWEIQVNTTGASNLTLSSMQGSSATGPANFKVQYKIGSGGTYTDIAGATVTLTTAVQAGQLATWGTIANVAVPAAANNQPSVYFRWIMTSNTAVNGSAVAATGTSRIAAIYVKGDYTGTVRNYVTGYQNLSAGNVTTYSVTGLAPSTTYYYVVRAENAGGYSQNSNTITVTTSAAVTPAFTASTLADFGNVCVNATGGPNSFTVTGSNLSGNVTVNALAGYTYSTTSGGTYTSTLTLTPVAGALNQTVYVRFAPTAAQSYNGPIALSGGGAATQQVTATGAGINTAPVVTTGAATGISTTGATLPGTIAAAGCSAVSASGFKYSTTSGFDPATTGTQVSASNLSSGSFSVTLAGLTPSTTYYYVAYGTNAGGTSYGAQQSFTTSINPSLSASALAGFGNVCLNTASSANSFTISGNNLTTADITVGPLAGYSFSTTSGGTYTNSLTLTQAGGTYSQQVFVKLTPTAVQSYNGNIPVSGGGVTTPVNVAATGAGVSTPPAVPTASTSAITTTSATVTGNVSSTGCSALTAYGAIYSTSNGFNPATSGTTVNGSTISAGSFSMNLTGLAPATTYYYVVFVTNAAGTTVYSGQQSFTTLTPSITTTTPASFGNQCLNTASTANSFTITGTNLTAADVTVGPLAGYTFSTTSGGTYTNSLTLTQTGGSFSQQVFVKLTPTAVQSYNGNIPVSGGGVATTVNVAATGAGINTAPAVTTAAATGVTTTAATIAGTISSTGCSAVTAYGAVYSTTNGFNPASAGTTVAGTGLTAGNFSANLSGLTPGTTYYYVTFATNAGGTSYSTQGSFTTTAAAAIPAAPVATAATATASTGFTANWNAVAGATGYFLDVYTLGSGSGSTTIAGWDMATNTAAAQTANQGNANNINIQTLTTNTGGVVSFPSGYSGTSGTPNPYSVSTNTWAGGAGNKYWQIDVNTSGATSLNLSFNQGGSGTGPRDFKVQYRVGAAGTWTDVPGGTVTIPGVVASPGTAATWAVVSNLALPVAAENQPLVSLRWLMTSETSINGTTVAATGTDRLSGIYVKSGTGTATPVYVTGYQNLSVGNVTSYNVTGLTPNTTYYYVVRATNAAGTSPNSNEITVATVSGPSLTATTLAAFGNVCPNTTGTANSFTINGSNLSNASITVGPLAGYAFSTTATGTYTPTLTLTQAGGTYSQQVFVQFTPTAVQSYNGNIPVSGGGVATAINVAASGAGVNNAPTVTTGAATAITNTTATAAGTINNNGCTAVTSYGIEWSTTNGFANGTGTSVTSTNAVAGAFSANLTGLTANTTYYYKAFATNAGGTSYGAQQSFTTALGPVISLTASTLASFNNVCVGTNAVDSFVITGVNLTNANIAVAALNGFTFATSLNGTYTPALSLTQPGGSYSQKVYVRFSPTAAQAYTGNIAISGGGAAATFNVNATGTGVVTPPSATTGDSTNIRFDAVTLRGSFQNNGCSAVTGYGIEYSGIPNFTAGTGTSVAATSNAAGAFSVNLSNLVPGTTYYYRAYASNAGATGYGTIKSVTLPGLQAGLRVFPQPVASGQSLRVTANGIQPGSYGIRLYSSAGEEVVRRYYNIQATYINERLPIPASLPAGVYVLRVTSNTDVIAHQTIIITH
jgi:phosphodiesterase/alkaline phosphatase D-like protein